MKPERLEGKAAAGLLFKSFSHADNDEGSNLLKA